VELEDGSSRDLEQMDHWVDPVEVDGLLTGEASFIVPGDLPIGWHVVMAESESRRAEAPLAMTPKALDPAAITGTRQWGFMTQLYATRSHSSWGLGDLRDCTTLAQWSATEHGAGFVLINPLHSAAPVRPMEPSPYLPVTRRFVNPIYLHVEDVPEIGRLGWWQGSRVRRLARRMEAMNTTDALLDRDAVWAAKRSALQSIFHAGMQPDRQQEFAAYCRVEGSDLRDFATWCAIADKHGGDTGAWPAELQDARGGAVEEFRARHEREITFHAWLQWQLDAQLTATQQAARDAGMAIGVMHDLAVGVHPGGADAWALRNVLAQGVSVGCPPDMYNQLGQDWSQPPWRPDALADAAFVPYRNMLRALLRASGGLRIDHVLGLFRMWWIPRGAKPYEGTYVRFDHDAMLGILCLEAQRAGAIVVGEDLGTVEPWVSDELRDRGILGTSILWFEPEREPAAWRPEVLASVTVHDLPPTAGYLRDEHVRIRNELNLLEKPVEVIAADARAEREAWAVSLREHGWLDRDGGTSDDLDAMAVALHRAVGASGARLIGIGLSDVVGDRRAQNQPGTYREYPNWCVPMTNAAGDIVLLEDVMADRAGVDALVQAVRPAERTR
jgi:4-alpha-glucanotransferase